MSFVLGIPVGDEKQVNKQIDEDIKFIKEIKSINTNTEIIIYVYSPVPTEGSDLYEQVKAIGFTFPDKLEDWINDTWENFDLRKNPLTPWLKPYMIDIRLDKWKRKSIKLISAPRYKFSAYQMPYEIKVLQKVWKYRQPEIEGF